MMRGSTRTDRLIAGVESALAHHRASHGWQPGYAWDPAAWRAGQDCGHTRPCGRYVPPSQDTWRSPRPATDLGTERHTLGIDEVDPAALAPARAALAAACEAIRTRPGVPPTAGTV